MRKIWNNVDRLYNLTNILSFLAMLVLLLDAMGIFKKYEWFDVDYAFGTIVVVMCVIMVKAKLLDIRRNAPNLIIPISKFAYFGSFVAFFAGWLYFEKYSEGQVVAYVIALILDAFSSVSAHIMMKKMKRKL